MRRLASGLALALFAASTASAQIPTLYNSGVDAAGNPLPNGVFDPHYTAYDYTSVGTPGTLLGQAQTINNGYQTYYAQNPTSRWIWADQSGNFNGLHYNTMFRTVFDLTGYDLTTVSINVSMAADNLINNVYLNGASLGQSFTGFFSFGNFTISSGFVSGLNTLDFYATDQGPPAAFNVFYTSQGSIAPVTTTPEPASMVLLGTGLLGVIGIARRRRNAIVA